MKKEGDEMAYGPDGIADDFEPSSPLSLAILAILTLIPHPDDQASREQSLIYRRNEAQAFAQSALESIEIESELIESSTSPSKALGSEGTSKQRTRFHPDVPSDLEPVQALDILSIYEYAQRGNTAKMRRRAGQALTTAMDASLHCESNENTEGSVGSTEARRRTWWMTVRRSYLIHEFELGKLTICLSSTSVCVKAQL